MKTIEMTQAQDDMAEVLRLVAAGERVSDPELRKRIEKRAESARLAVFERNGTLDIAVPYVRALRDGE